MTLSNLIPEVSEVKAIAFAVAGGAIVLAIAGLAIALTITRHTLADRTAQRDSLESWQAIMRQATSTAAHIEKNHKPALLALDQVQPQIVYLGRALDQANDAIAEQNKTIDGLKTSGDARIEAGNAGVAQVAKNRAGADKAATDLRASAAGNTAKTTCVGSVTYLKHSGEL